MTPNFSLDIPSNQIDILPELKDLPSCTRHAFWIPVDMVADEHPVGLAVNVIIGNSPVPRLLMVSGVHGNEYDAILAQLEFWLNAVPEELFGSVVMVPIANPPAFHAMLRTSPIDNLDMNRVFPGDPNGTVTQRLAYRLHQDVLPGSDFVLSMHGWHEWGSIVPYIEFPKNSQVTQASREAACDFGVRWIEAFDWIPGLLVEAASKTGIPAIEAEVGGLGISQPEYRAIYQKGILNILKHLHILPSVPESNMPTEEVVRTEIRSDISGIFMPHVSIGQPVERGDSLFRIIEPNGKLLKEKRADRSGIVASLRMKGYIQADNIAMVLFYPINSNV